MRLTTTPRALAVSAVALLAALSARAGAQAFPIAPPGTEGLRVVVGGSGPVVATYLGNSAAFSDNLFLALDAAGAPGDDGDLANDRFLFNNLSTPVGSTVNLGSFVPGTELIFRLFVRDTGNNFFSGPASRNPDGRPHARVQAGYAPGTTLVSFEDLLDTPEFPGGYNDLSFSFTNTTAAGVVPEPSTYVLFAAGLGGLGLIARRWRSA